MRGVEGLKSFLPRKSRCTLLFSRVNHDFIILAFEGFSCLGGSPYLRREEWGLGLASGRRRLEAGL